VLTADLPLHLEDHLDVARIEGSEVPEDIPAPVEWHFDEPQPDWKPVIPLVPSVKPLQMTRTDDSLRITLTEATEYKQWEDNPNLCGGIYIELPDWQREDWGDILVRARTSDEIEEIWIDFNLRDEIGPNPWEEAPFRFRSERAVVMRDGSEQTYAMRADWSMDYLEQWEGPWRQMGVSVCSREPASIEILSVSVIPKEAGYTDAPAGVRTEVRDQEHRRTLYTHAPARLEYRVRVPEAARLDVGLGVLRDDAPVTFRVSALLDGGASENLLEETYANRAKWAQRSLDLSHLAGQEVTLALETDADSAGTVALWAVPTLSGPPTTNKPNVIFYIIDGGSADYMSVYGYNRRTTPNLERLAAEGVLFESAHSNAAWTRPSTLSFVTSLQHSVMGGLKNNRNAPPEEVSTLPEHMHRAGYQTALFTSNPNAATMSGLDRGVDVLRENSVDPTSVSTRDLHHDFWRWRKEYPGEPYYVRFQTTDVHWPHNPPAPFAGLFIGPERRKVLDEWEDKLTEASHTSEYRDADFEKTGISRFSFYDGKRGLYNETMAHQDLQIGRLVERLKAAGEWENTLLIIAADHGVVASTWDFAIGLLDSLPPLWRPTFRTGVSHIPLIFVWPGHILPDQRLSEQVSMIDMLPTILDLAELPMPEVMQGQSLAPLLLGNQGWEPRPVIFDEFYEDRNTGKLLGWIEVLDGRWGASLEINQDPENDDRPPEERRPVPLLIYDLWNDPYCLESLHEERPDLVKKYTQFLEAQFEQHQALAQQFSRPEDSPLTPEQLRTLRSLGYIQ
jgi:arylsulfatase A-like enzyme